MAEGGFGFNIRKLIVKQTDLPTRNDEPPPPCEREQRLTYPDDKITNILTLSIPN
jgi:hypothetical protein